MAVTTGLGATEADISLLLTADSLPELFTSAAVYLAELMFSGSRAGQVIWLPLSLSGQDYPDLLVALLNEVVYQADGEAKLVVAMHLDILDENQLRGRLGVIPLDPSQHVSGHAVKAATYHQAEVAPISRERWRAKVILDV